MTWSEYDEEFNNADAGSFRVVPPGVYQVWVERAIFDQPDWADHPRLHLTCKVLHGEYKGCALFPSGDCNPQYIRYLKGMLIKMGFNPAPRPSQIEDRLTEMLDRVLEVKVSENRTRPQFPKVYINRFVGMLHEVDAPPMHTDDDGRLF